MATRREFVQKAALGTAGLTLGAKSYSRILGANDRIRIGIVGYSDRFRGSLLPAFLSLAKELNFEFTALSDIWSLRREEADKFFKAMGITLRLARNNDELYSGKDTDAVIISTADFQHALLCAEAVEAGRDAYVEKPFAETMADARTALKAVQKTGKIVQIGSQRRSAPNYIAANEYLNSGKFGKIVIVEMTWNVNQPGRWRRPNVVPLLIEADTDWKRYQMNRPPAAFDARKYLEFRLFWPYSSGIPGQWMAHQIDTVHWFTKLAHPRSVAANGGIYLWKDGRTNYDTMTAVMEYGDPAKPDSGFQVVYSSRFTNSAGGTKELYYSNGGMLNLDTNKVTSEGGLTEREAKAMNMKPNLLEPFDLPGIRIETAADTGGDPMTTAHMKNWMECVRDRKKPNADVVAGYNHSIACIMCTAALRTGEKASFNEAKQEVLAGGKYFNIKPEKTMRINCNKKVISALFLISVFILSSGTAINARKSKIKFVRADDKQKIDVLVDGKLFTSYQYPSNMEKPYLFPVIAPDGSVITRGFPLEPGKGERVDHPHHIGIWFNHGNVNGLDFWNNSSAIPASKKSSYGHIVVKQIVKAKKRVIEVISDWNDNKDNTLLVENTKYIFSTDRNSRTIDHISTLTAANGPVTFTDNKEGMFAIRVDRAFEMPSNESLIFTDDKGNPTTVKATDNTGVTGMYTSSSGLKGDNVWSSRNDWVMLSGTKDNVLTTIAVFDHPKNMGYPAHSHARGYGLFSTNNLGANSYVPGEEKIVVTLQKGESITLRHRFYVQSGSELIAEAANKIFQEFSKLY